MYMAAGAYKLTFGDVEQANTPVFGDGMLHYSAKVANPRHASVPVILLDPCVPIAYMSRLVLQGKQVPQGCTFAYNHIGHYYPIQCTYTQTAQLLSLLLAGDFLADLEAHKIEPLMLAPTKILVQAPVV